jgi:hypothetical protein
MNPKEFVKALVRAADSDAADNKPKRDADNEAELLRYPSVNFGHRYDSSREPEPEKEQF